MSSHEEGIRKGDGERVCNWRVLRGLSGFIARMYKENVWRGCAIYIRVYIRGC